MLVSYYDSIYQNNNLIFYEKTTLFAVLKPCMHLSCVYHYNHRFSGLILHYDKEHPDYEDCYATNVKLSATAQNVSEILKRSVIIILIPLFVLPI